MITKCYKESLLQRSLRPVPININGGGKRKIRMQMCKGSLLKDFAFICGSFCGRLHLLTMVSVGVCTSIGYFCLWPLGNL